jgi:hypothetical protein
MTQATLVASELARSRRTIAVRHIAVMVPGMGGAMGVLANGGVRLGMNRPDATFAKRHPGCNGIARRQPQRNPSEEHQAQRPHWSGNH